MNRNITDIAGAANACRDLDDRVTSLEKGIKLLQAAPNPVAGGITLNVDLRQVTKIEITNGIITAVSR